MFLLFEKLDLVSNWAALGLSGFVPDQQADNPIAGTRPTPRRTGSTWTELVGDGANPGLHPDCKEKVDLCGKTYLLLVEAELN